MKLVNKHYCNWVDNTKMDLKGIWYGGVHWIHLALDRVPWWAVVKTVMNLRDL
jgi:hypothetical protein